MIIEDFILHCKKQYNNEELSEEDRDKYLFVGRSLVELLAYKQMYKDDIVRFDQYYKSIDKTICELEEMESDKGDDE